MTGVEGDGMNKTGGGGAMSQQMARSVKAAPISNMKPGRRHPFLGQENNMIQPSNRSTPPPNRGQHIAAKKVQARRVKTCPLPRRH